MGDIGTDSGILAFALFSPDVCGCRVLGGVCMIRITSFETFWKEYYLQAKNKHINFLACRMYPRMFIQSQQYKEENYGPKRCQGNCNETFYQKELAGEADIDAVLAIETGYSI